MSVNAEPFEPKLLGQQLRQLRERAGLSRGSVAKSLGVHENTIGKFERGDSTPNARSIPQFAAMLRMPLP